MSGEANGVRPARPGPMGAGLGVPPDAQQSFPGEKMRGSINSNNRVCMSGKSHSGVRGGR